MTDLLNRWLFRPGGQYNIAVSRIAIALALWLSLHDRNIDQLTHNYTAWIAAQAGAGWVPKGMIKLFGLNPPPLVLVDLLFRCAQISILMMAIGFLTPWSQIVAALSTTFIISLQTSFQPYWSHAFNVQLLAALAFMFGRSSDVWSVDSMLRQWRGRALKPRGNIYWWPVLFAELATALFMTGAFFQKFRETGVHWALSDNLRNSISISWFQYRTAPPEIALWLANNAWAWKAAGMMQLFAQATTVLAVFFVARPVFRLIFGGLFFLGEIIGLSQLFHFWHPFWIPLCLLSVDWEYFYGRMKGTIPAPPTMAAKLAPILSALRRALLAAWRQLARAAKAIAQRLTSPHLSSAPLSVSTRTSTFVIAFGCLFFGYYIATLGFRWGEKHMNYPFSTMGFYSETRANRPFRKHGYWPIYTGRADVYEDSSDAAAPKDIWYREGLLEDQLHRVSTIDDLESIDRAFGGLMARGLYFAASPSEKGKKYDFRPSKPEKVIYRAGLMAVPPFPAKAGLVDLHMGYRAVRDGKNFRSVVGHLRWDNAHGQYVIDIEHKGFKQPQFEMLARYNVREAPALRQPEKLAGTWEGNSFHVLRDDDPRYIYSLIKVSDAALGITEIYYGPDNFQSYR